MHTEAKLKLCVGTHFQFHASRLCNEKMVFFTYLLFGKELLTILGR